MYLKAPSPNVFLIALTVISTLFIVFTVTFLCDVLLVKLPEPYFSLFALFLPFIWGTPLAIVAIVIIKNLTRPR